MNATLTTPPYARLGGLMIRRQYRLFGQHLGPRPVAHLLRVAVVSVCGLLWSGQLQVPSSQCYAQMDGSGGRPPAVYFSAFTSLNDGRFSQARGGFRNAARGGLRTVDGQWVDAVCYHVMIGECLYQQGNYDQALQQYNDGLLVLMSNPTWMRRVQFLPGAITAATNRRLNPPTWGPSNRNPQPANLSQSWQVMLGNPNLEQVAQQGGVLAPPELHLLNVPEVIRCTALALRRRRQILGPICRYDPLSARLVVALEGRIGPANHWVQAWIDIQRGLALTGVDKFDEALPLFQRAITLAGQYDHPLTATALFELGNIADQSGDTKTAENYFFEASLAAGYYDQIQLVEESLQRAVSLRLAAGNHEPMPALAAANAWATRQRLRHLDATVSRLTAENLAAAGKSKQALSKIDRARKTFGRRAEMAAQLAADLDYVAALANYQTRNSSTGSELLQSAIKQQQACSTWLYQIVLANDLYQKNREIMTARIATKLYGHLLREPTRQDWQSQPLETLAYTLAPELNAYQNWLEAAVERSELDTMIQIGEALRQRRFGRYLSLGGRMLSLRWLMEADKSRLADKDLDLRRELQLRYPEYEKLSIAAQAALDKLRGLPVNPDEKQQFELTSAAKQLNLAAKQQELLLGQIALQRQYCPTIFPPRLSQEELQAKLTANQVLLAFTGTPRGIQAIMLSHDKQATWTIPNSKIVRKNVVSLLRSIGMHDDNSTLTAKQLQQSDWEPLAGSLTQQLFDESQQGFWNRFDELIIVPDGFLWYLPFEALIVDDAKEQFPLIARMSIRYAPTMSLAVTSSREKSRHDQTVTVLGQMFPREDQTTARQEFEQMQTVVAGLEALPERLPVPTSLLRSVWDRLLVLDDVGDARKGPLEWVPAKLDAKGDNSLKRWLRLPWGAPEQVLLPGFHSAAESGLKQQADGDDLFAAVMAMMATGTRTVLISRWRTGGQTSYELMREFMQEAPHSQFAEAWQRSVQVVREKEIDPRREPRIAYSSNAEPIQATHPFFWAGYMIVDNGETADEKPADEKPVEPSRAEVGA